MPSKYTFSEYTSEWSREFCRESARLQSLLGAALVAVHHIGSTSVAGLPAKPIIDLLPVVHDIQRIDDCTPVLEDAGYKAWGEYGLAGRRFFTKDRGRVYARHPADILAYNNGKDAWIKRIEPLAIEWFRHAFSSRGNGLK